ncbi:COMM domain-containing protein 5 isoform X2 [Serinus canaria]|uniref:COMM domain-containing protein 5 isoform X2 n=1 Tax=Serinus canaria TaxID=9135 RepID=UPI0021CCAA52|nr:COMM domain-containing protein 5 isoform X2 [Serinus canaria]
MAAGAAQGLGEGGGGRGFLGPRVPAEVEAMARGVQDVGKETFRRLLKVTVNALEGKDCKESVRLIAESANLSEEQLAFLISGMYTLLREALRLPLSSFKQEVFKEDLKELRIPEDFIVDFSSVVFGNRAKSWTLMIVVGQLSFLKLEVTQHMTSLTQCCSRFSAWNPNNHSCGFSVTLKFLSAATKAKNIFHFFD